MSWDKFQEALNAKRKEHTIDPAFEVCNNLMYTLKRLGFVDVTRHIRARELYVLHKAGPEGLREHRQVIFVI